jgi:hypothetical protein
MEEIINNSQDKGHVEIERTRTNFARQLVFSGEGDRHSGFHGKEEQ